jgi:DNA topoisomerase-2
MFVGKIDTTGDKWFIEGLYEFQSKSKLLITEIPIRYDRVKYIAVLDKLVETDKIVSYEEIRGTNEFCFRVTLKRGGDMTHDQIVTMFKLRQNISQNINVIVPDPTKPSGEALKTYDTAADLIMDFVSFRMPFLTKRIETQIVASERRCRLTSAKCKFIEMVRSGEISLHGKTRKQLVSELEANESFNEFSDELVSMNLYHMTDDELVKLQKANQQAEAEVRYWKSTTEQKQFLKDLDGLVK